MKIAIQAYRKYGEGYIAKQKLFERLVIEYYVDLCERFFKAELIYVVYDDGIKDFLDGEFKDDKRVKLTSLKDVETIKDSVVIDMQYFYDFKKLKKLVKRKKELKSAQYFKIEKEKDITNIKDFAKRDYRAFWNPLARYYKEPIGEWLAEVLKDSWLTPNFVSIVNVLLFSLIFVLLIFNGSYLSMILLAILIHVFHIWDIVDGHLARLKDMRSSYGGWIDGSGDKFLFHVIVMSIALALFIKEGNTFYLVVALFLLAGQAMYSYVSMLSDRFFTGHMTKDKLKMKVKGMVLVKSSLLFLDNDIMYHTLSLFAIINRIEWFLIFYGVYFNFAWLSYVAYYSYRYIKTGE